MSSAETSAGFHALPGDERLTTAILSDSCDAAGRRDQVLSGRLAPVITGDARHRARPHGAVRAVAGGRPGRSVRRRHRPDRLGAPGAADRDLDRPERRTRPSGASSSAPPRSARGPRAWSPTAISGTRTGSRRSASRPSRARDGPSTSGRGSASSMPTSRSSSAVCAIDPGAIVMADDDGVVVVPLDIEDRVLALARERASRRPPCWRSSSPANRCVRCGTATASSEPLPTSIRPKESE